MEYITPERLVLAASVALTLLGFVLPASWPITQTIRKLAVDVRGLIGGGWK